MFPVSSSLLLLIISVYFGHAGLLRLSVTFLLCLNLEFGQLCCCLHLVGKFSCALSTFCAERHDLRHVNYATKWAGSPA